MKTTSSPAPLASTRSAQRPMGEGGTMTKAEAGRMGGKKTVKRYGKRYMRKLGKWGAHRMHATYRLTPVDRNDFALVHRQTGEVKAYLSGKPLDTEGLVK